MSKKIHIGNGGTPRCSRRLSLNRSTRVRPSLTKPLEEFLKLPRESQCERCLKNHVKANDTTEFAAGLAQALGITATKELP